MINTQAFKTKTILQPRNNPKTDNYWGVAIDIGYSSVKLFSPNVIASFPSYAKQVEFGKADNPIGGLEKTSIAYRDENGNEYFVGASAQSLIKTGDSDSSTAMLYVRNRCNSPEFKAITRVGLALGMMKNQYGSPADKILHVQTGLPPEYLKDEVDVEDLKSCISGHHEFSIKLGLNNWMKFSFDVAWENIGVMPQPMGTLVSISTDDNGGKLPEAKKYFSSNVLIIDPGFGTLDTFEIKNHYVDTSKTWNNLGMLRVMQEMSKMIKDEYGQIIPVPAMQKVLGDGYFKSKMDKATRSQKNIPAADILDKANRMICEEALTALNGFYNYMQDEDYLVITGGTGAAWEQMIRKYYEKAETLKIIPGVFSDNVPIIFSNVRGYYMTQLNALKKLSVARTV